MQPQRVDRSRIPKFQLAPSQRIMPGVLGRARVPVFVGRPTPTPGTALQRAQVPTKVHPLPPPPCIFLFLKTKTRGLVGARITGPHDPTALCLLLSPHHFPVPDSNWVDGTDAESPDCRSSPNSVSNPGRHGESSDGAHPNRSCAGQ